MCVRRNSSFSCMFIQHTEELVLHSDSCQAFNLHGIGLCLALFWPLIGCLLRRVHHTNRAVFQLQTFWPGAGPYSRFWGVICRCKGGLVLNLRLLHVHQGNKTKNICTLALTSNNIRILYLYSSKSKVCSVRLRQIRSGKLRTQEDKVKKDKKGLKHDNIMTQSINTEQWKDRKKGRKGCKRQQVERIPAIRETSNKII